MTSFKSEPPSEPSLFEASTGPSLTVESPASKVRRKLDRQHDPKIHGHMPGFPVGATFLSRTDLCHAGVHAMSQAGIHGTENGPAYSIVMSGRYSDDCDEGKTFVYPGEGGRTKKYNENGERTFHLGDHNADQDWSRGNKSLLLSFENFKNSQEDPNVQLKPVRVVRGHHLNSRYAPVHGYRYDGLYKVISATYGDGKTNFKTCKFTFERLPGQPPLPNEVLPPREFRASSSVAGLSRDGTEAGAEGSEPPHKRIKLDDDNGSIPFKCNTAATEVVVNRRRNRVSKKRDPNAPKRPVSSYLLFQNAVYGDVKGRFPDLVQAELQSKIKTQWADMSEAQKAVYRDRANKDMERYSSDKSTYNMRSSEEVPLAEAEVASAVALNQATPLARTSPVEQHSGSSNVSTPFADAPASTGCLLFAATTSASPLAFRCLCGGKVDYESGPSETLDNYEVHVKNYSHYQLATTI
ncbi:E3 ubiquitin-protein ligase ORTHRUS 2 [Mycena venus]|uniref:E3 ubiquitin-protein ligase ORTHRUS 2 n=1 Tax=Mycena venus TaxID=2733690 RepID=A0A8H6WXI2_9AGAR|nr:E3 ubiquitin-protein ligase ORTHRUS 2 [Mycena venus]